MNAQETPTPSVRGRLDRPIVVCQRVEHGRGPCLLCSLIWRLETISRLTDNVICKIYEWSARPLDEVYAAILIDATVVKIRDGQVANRLIYATIRSTLARRRTSYGSRLGPG